MAVAHGAFVGEIDACHAYAYMPVKGIGYLLYFTCEAIVLCRH
jgi:hypothetical protein